MITVSISINGEPIYTRTAINISKGPRTKEQTYKLDDGTIINHQVKDGAVKLAQKMLDTIKEV